MPSQFLEVLRGDEACMEYNRDLRDFFEAVFAGIKEEDGEGGIGVLQSVVRAILDDVAKELKEAPFMFLNARQTRVLEYLADSPAAAMVLIIYNFPLNTNSQVLLTAYTSCPDGSVYTATAMENLATANKFPAVRQLITSIIQGEDSGQLPGVGILWFRYSTILPNRPVDCNKLPSATAEPGRQWNVQIIIHPKSLFNPTQVTDHHPHPVLIRLH